MPKIRGFRPLVFTDEITSVISPPFDSISRELEHVLKKHAHNITHLTLPEKRTDGYVADLFNSWKSQGVFQTPDKDVIAVIDLSYNMGGESRTLRGMISLVRIFPDEDEVRPHERTFPRPIAERVRIMGGMGAQLEPIYLAADSNGLESTLNDTVQGTSPDLEFVDYSGVTVRVFLVSGEDLIKRIQAELLGTKVIVADGHHRLAATKQLAEISHGKERDFWSWIMAFTVPLKSTGLRIGGIHRFVKFPAYQTVDFTSGQPELNVDQSDHMIHTGDLQIYDGKWHTISPSWDHCRKFPDSCLSPVHLLNNAILKGIMHFTDSDFQDRVFYTHDVSEATQSVDRGEAAFAAIIPEWDRDNLMNLIVTEGFLPQKSTFFYPKAPSGLFINAMNPID